MTGTDPARKVELSAVETRVLALIELGLDNHEIAALLGIGRSTLKTHIRQAYRRLGVTTRAEAVAWVEDARCAAGRSARHDSDTPEGNREPSPRGTDDPSSVRIG